MNHHISVLLAFMGLVSLNIAGQANQTQQLFVPFLDKESQSNVTVTVADLFGAGQPCPSEYTNTLSNTNLFTSKERETIKTVLKKYKEVTTNSGPSGSVLTSLYQTNLIMKIRNRSFTNQKWVATFIYTNSVANEEIRFGSGLLAEFKDTSSNGYGVSFNRTGNGTLLSVWEIQNGAPNGLLVRLDDRHPQGTNWNYSCANFTNFALVEYSRHTNRMIFGKFLMWNPQNGNLILEADFKKPYDFEKYRTDLQMLQ